MKSKICRCIPSPPSISSSSVRPDRHQHKLRIRITGETAKRRLDRPPHSRTGHPGESAVRHTVAPATPADINQVVMALGRPSSVKSRSARRRRAEPKGFSSAAEYKCAIFRLYLILERKTNKRNKRRRFPRDFHDDAFFVFLEHSKLERDGDQSQVMKSD